MLIFSSCEKERLTEQEQKEFKGCIERGPMVIDLALKYMKILLKGSPDTIHYYKEHEGDEKIGIIARKETLYAMDLCTMAYALAYPLSNIKQSGGKNYFEKVLPNGEHSIEFLSERELNDIEKGYKLILKALEKKQDYPDAILCIIKAIALSRNFDKDKKATPLLKKSLYHKDMRVRLESAGALLLFDEADISLTIIEKLAMDGNMSAIDMLFQPTSNRLWDERGKEIIIKLLNSPSYNIRAYAAEKLIIMGINQKDAMDTAINVLSQYIKIRDSNNRNSVDRSVVYRSLNIIEHVRGKDGITVLNALTRDNDKGIKERARVVLEKIKKT